MASKHIDYSSSFSYFNNLYEINKMVFAIVVNNFGFGNETNSLKVFCKLSDMSDNDRNKFLWFATKYRFSVINTPFIVMDEYKNWLLEQCKYMCTCTVYANSMYPYNEYELNKKRSYINEAINACEMMIQISQFAEILFKVDHEKILPLIKLLLDQKDQLKNWKRSTQKVFNELKKQEILKEIQTQMNNNQCYYNSKEDAYCPVEFIDSTDNIIDRIKQNIKKEKQSVTNK